MKSLPRIVLPVALATVIAMGVFTSFRLSQAPSPQQILERTEKTYEQCRFYNDSGAVKVVPNAKDNSFGESEVSFTTAFVRPNQFRFESVGKFSGRPNQCIIWNKDKETYSWTFWRPTPPETKKHQSLGNAIATSFGISLRAGGTIPFLLMPKDVGEGIKRFSEMKQIERLEDEGVNGVACFRVKGNAAIETQNVEIDSEETTLWISKEDSLIRKFEAKSSLLGTLTITYQPRIDIEITEEALKFNKPKS